MDISVQYFDGRTGGVSTYMFDVLLRENKINKFFRYSEKRWVTVGSYATKQSGQWQQR